MTKQGKQPLLKKGAGCGSQWSDVTCSTVDWLKDVGQQLEYGKNYEGYWTGALFVKQVGNSQVFLNNAWSQIVQTAQRKDHPCFWLITLKAIPHIQMMHFVCKIWILGQVGGKLACRIVSICEMGRKSLTPWYCLNQAISHPWNLKVSVLFCKNMDYGWRVACFSSAEMGQVIQRHYIVVLPMWCLHRQIDWSKGHLFKKPLRMWDTSAFCIQRRKDAKEAQIEVKKFSSKTYKGHWSD